MRKIDALADRSLAVATRTRDLIVPSAAGVRDWVASGAALTAARGGAKTAGRFARRNPALAIATVVVGAGVLAYGAYRRRKAQAPITGEAEAGEATSVRKPKQVPTRTVRSDGAASTRKPARKRAATEA